jgi:tRNA (cytidine56-2'-O)-methyltransferase
LPEKRVRVDVSGALGDSVIRVLSVGREPYKTNAEMCLVARAFGASGITFSSRRDPRLSRFVQLNNSKWGGSFSVDFDSNYVKALDPESSYKKVYLTMYGMPLQDVIGTLRTYKNLLLIVTDKEAVAPVYTRSDFNVSVTGQPHTSASAVAVFLHEFYSGRELAMHFGNARYKILPSEQGMHVEKVR